MYSENKRDFLTKFGSERQLNKLVDNNDHTDSIMHRSSVPDSVVDKIISRGNEPYIGYGDVESVAYNRNLTHHQIDKLLNFKHKDGFTNHVSNLAETGNLNQKHIDKMIDMDDVDVDHCLIRFSNVNEKQADKLFDRHDWENNPMFSSYSARNEHLPRKHAMMIVNHPDVMKDDRFTILSRNKNINKSDMNIIRNKHPDDFGIRIKFNERFPSAK